MFGLMFISCLLSRFAFHADAGRLNSSSSDTSMLLNADTTVLRQLLNQETLIRMSVVKNVDNLMKDIVTLKDSMTSLQNEVISIKQISKDKQDYVMKELEGIKRQIHLLNDTQMIFEENLKKQNSTGLDLLNMVEKSKAEGRRFQTDTRKSLEEAKKNTTDESLDLKMQVRVLSTSLMRLNEHVQQQDKSFHQLIENNYKAASELITNASLNVQEKTNASLHDLMSDLSETKQNQLRLSAGVLSLEWFRNNISGGVIKMKERNAPTAFTAGVTDSSSYWSSGILVFPTILYNIGRGYDSSTGIFTSPEDGTYVFYVTIRSYNSYSIDVDIVKNGISKVRVDTHGTYQTGTNMAVLSLDRGDKVWVKFHSGQGYYSTSTPVTSFTGFQI
ncbi:uncharacterized protein LOC111111419 [Crassostrea virginica]|uniref:Multimerin-2-like n=1 Tax=Crassostrea virginica TaxID=6565 RepID=A0A8B8BLB5_CRAVI|nr:multimerin-2-like [Crassostrea virginica]